MERKQGSLILSLMVWWCEPPLNVEAKVIATKPRSSGFYELQNNKALAVNKSNVCIFYLIPLILALVPVACHPFQRYHGYFKNSETENEIE